VQSYALVKVKLALTYVIILLSDLSIIFAKMIIGINICGRVKEDGDQPINFIIERFNKIAIEHPEHSFVFITDRIIENKVANVKNTTVITIDQKPKNTFFWKFWYDHKLEKTAKKQNIELLINLDAVCSLKSKISQFLFIDDLPVLHATPIKKKHLQFYKRNTPKFLQKANRIAAASEFFKKEIVDRYKINEIKIDVVQGSIDKKFAPIIFEEKEKIKEKYTDGREYFLYAGELNTEKNWINLLKAFSFFKKRQKSNMQLLIVTNTIADSDFANSFKTYKYREEVKVLFGLSIAEKAKITASAYAFVCPSLYEIFPARLMEAMQCGVPVVASNIDSIIEIADDAVLYADPKSFEDIADKMMLLFKDENKRNELIIKGNRQALHYSVDKTAHVLWQSIVKTTPV
jgi:glycosyltransferase involved in cell wall biosynthesis